MKKFLLAILCLCCGELFASHIVGGEFELLHVSGNTYRLNLIIYFDRINGAPGAKDPNATVSIFRKSNDTFISSVVLLLDSESSVDYTQPECSNGEIVTDKLIYTTTLTLDPEVFDEEEGYYVAWERCCRNYTISNIFSQDPASGGVAAGQTFYLEFPPVVRNGEPFINSSPRLFPPLNDFACPNRPYYVDFAGVDDDGDSLVYSLSTPLNTHSQVALPAIQSRPYPVVTWRPGFNDDNIINGAPDLRISTDGLLTATPTTLGLFVFAVQIREYRNKELIGVNRRDFQMLVVDGCSPAVPPTITGPTSVLLDHTDVGAARCITVTVTDDDSTDPAYNFTENIRVRAVGLNFNDKDIPELFPAEVTATLTNGSSKDFTICFPVCPFFLGGPAEIGIIAMDDACSLPLLDTLKITVDVQPPPNVDPYFISSSPVNTVLLEGQQSGPLVFEARDDDADALLVSVVTDGFVLQEAGITYTPVIDDLGRVVGQLSWDAFCDIYDFTQRTSFQVKILVNDQDQCELNEPIEAIYNFNVILPGNADPIIDTDLTLNPAERLVTGIERKVFQSLTFDVTGEDLVDNDFLVLDFLRSDALGIDHVDSLDNYGISFEKKEGNTSLQSKVHWDLLCEKLDLENQSIVDLQFLVIDDQNKCRIYKADTVEVEVTLLPPDNLKPTMVINSLNENVVLTNNAISVTRGEQIVLGLQGSDVDFSPQDSIRLEMIAAEGNVNPTGFVFAPAEGTGSVSTTFSWNPDCSIFENGVYENNYTFTFALNDGRCFNAKADTLSVDVTIKDIVSDDTGFVPINFFSPNDDQINDYYSMERLNQDGELENILPLDNCVSQFQAIRVYNRWGKEVFESTDRNFKWLGKNEAAGVYYYLIKYSNKEYKGALSIRY
ncbi:MAG: gliding motility-associated C-terminal domain-containing protein [Cyclobacteriaceae bacterium]